MGEGRGAGADGDVPGHGHLTANRPCGPAALRSVSTMTTAQDGDAPRPAGRGAGARAGQLHRRPVRRPAARRLRRRRDQGRAARRGRPDAALGRHARRRQPVVAGDRPQQAVGRPRPARRRGPRRGAAPGRARATSCSRTSGPAGSRSGASATTTCPRDNPALVARAHQRLRSDRARWRTRPASAASARRWAASATRRATPTGRRPAAGISLGDALAAMFAVIGALAALTEARRSGHGPGGRRRDLRGGGRADGVDDGRLRARRRAPRAAPAACCPAWRRRTCTPPPTAPRSLIAGNADSVFARLCVAMGAARTGRPTSATRPTARAAPTWPSSTS